MNELDIKAPEGYEIDEARSDLSTGVIRFKEVKQGLVKSWKDLGQIEGWFVNEDSYVLDFVCSTFSSEEQNTWATKEQAEASIAMAMLSQLMKQANGDWTPDWTDGKSKYSIARKSEYLVDWYSVDTPRFLAFKSEEIRDEFLELHRDLIEKAKSLL